MAATDDGFVGEIFLDLDSRSENRRLRLIEPARSVAGRRRWKAEVITNNSNPAAIGRHVTVSERTLNDNYRKVSH